MFDNELCQMGSQSRFGNIVRFFSNMFSSKVAVHIIGGVPWGRSREVAADGGRARRAIIAPCHVTKDVVVFDLQELAVPPPTSSVQQPWRH